MDLRSLFFSVRRLTCSLNITRLLVIRQKTEKDYRTILYAMSKVPGASKVTLQCFSSLFIENKSGTSIHIDLLTLEATV